MPRVVVPADDAQFDAVAQIREQRAAQRHVLLLHVGRGRPPENVVARRVGNRVRVQELVPLGSGQHLVEHLLGVVIPPGVLLPVAGSIVRHEAEFIALILQPVGVTQRRAKRFELRVQRLHIAGRSGGQQPAVLAVVKRPTSLSGVGEFRLHTGLAARVHVVRCQIRDDIAADLEHCFEVARRLRPVKRLQHMRVDKLVRPRHDFVVRQRHRRRVRKVRHAEIHVLAARVDELGQGDIDLFAGAILVQPRFGDGFQTIRTNRIVAYRFGDGSRIDDEISRFGALREQFGVLVFADAVHNRAAQQHHTAVLYGPTSQESPRHRHRDVHYVAVLPGPIQHVTPTFLLQRVNRHRDLVVHAQRDFLAPSRRAEPKRERHWVLALSRERQFHVAVARVRGFLPNRDGLPFHVERLLRVGEQIQRDAALRCAVVYLLRHFGHRPAIIPAAAEEVAGVVLAVAGERGEVADPASVGRVGREQGVVDGAFEQIAVAHVAFQPHEAVHPSQHVGGDARFADGPASVLVVGELFAVGARAGDEHAALALLEQLVAHELAHVQEILLTGEAVQFGLGVAACEHDVHVARGAAEILLPRPERRELDLAVVIPVRHVGGEVEVPLVTRHAVQFQHPFRQARRADVARVVARILRRGKRLEDVVAHDLRVGQRLGIARAAIVPHERQVDVLLLVQNPVDVVLPILRLDVPEPEVPVGVAGLHQFVDDVLRARGDFRVTRVGGEQAAGVEHLANAVIDVLLVAAVRAVAKVIEPLAVQIDHHVVLVNQILDAAIDFSAEFLLVECHAAEFVRHPRLYDIGCGHHSPAWMDAAKNRPQTSLRLVFLMVGLRDGMRSSAPHPSAAQRVQCTSDWHLTARPSQKQQRGSNKGDRYILPSRPGRLGEGHLLPAVTRTTTVTRTRHFRTRPGSVLGERHVAQTFVTCFQ